MSGSGGAIGVYAISNESIAEGYSLANRFTPSAAYTIYGVRWSRHLTAPFPTKLYLYDSTAGSTVQTWTPAAGDWWQVDNEWWDFDLARAGLSNATLTSGHTYYITYYLGAANSWQRYNGSNAPLVGITFNDCRFQLADTPNPSTSASGTHGIDVRVVPWPEPTQSGTAPATDASVGSGLAEWLSSNSGVNTHQSDGAPWQTLQDAATLLSRLGNVTSGNVTTYGLSDATLVAAVLKALNYLVTNGNNLNSLSDLVDRIWTWFGGTSSPPTTDALATILNRLDLATEGAETDTHELVRRQLAWGTFPTGWTLQGSADIDGNLAFTTAADAYALTITTPYPGEGALATAAGTYLPRLGWWCPLQGSYGRQRQFIDLGQLLLVDEGRRMPGCAVQLQPGTLATIEAWTID